MHLAYTGGRVVNMYLSFYATYAFQVARYSWDSWPSALLVLVCPEPHRQKVFPTKKNTENSELRTLIISTSWSTPLSPGKMGCPKISSALALGCLGSQSFCCNFTHTSTQISSPCSNPQGLTETQAMDQISITSVPSNL